MPELVRGAGGGVFDFDGTWHPGNQWVGARGLMSPPDQAEDLRDIEAYFARPAHDDHDDVAFILRSIERLRRSDCSRSMLEALACGLVPRTGAAPLMKSIGFDRSAVITFGMYDVVRENLRRFLVHACWSQVEVFGLRLEWLPGQTFRGPLLPTVVTDGAKGYLRRAFCGSRGIAPNKTLVVGDSPTDIQMMGPDVVGCFLIPKVDPAPGRMAHRLARLEQMWGQVACVVVSDDLTPLLEMRQK